ncbi:MAG: hypothetical protein K8R87_13135 [Verrucomicrobia bacterium]|nr:hypothetical protein [Verrucomicrobiota bacterium]
MPSEQQKFSFLSWPVIVLILAVVAGLGWWIIQKDTASPVTVEVPPTKSEASKKKPLTPIAPVIAPPVTSDAPPTPAAVPREDEDKIHAWLTGFDDTNEIAAAILAGWKQLSEPGRTAAAPHLLNLVPDERFTALADILMDPTTNGEVKDIFFAGVLNRGDEIKWPLILRVMEQKDHPHSQEARNMLTVVLGKDLGDDWPAWRELMRTQLLKQVQP